MQSKSTVRSSVRHKPPTPRRSSTKESASSKSVFSEDTLRAYLYTLAIGAASILILSLGAYFHPDPDSIIRPLAYIAAGLTSFLGGMIAGRLRRGAPALCGLTNGILLTCTMILLSFFFTSESSNYSALISALLHAAVPLLSFLGALTGVKKSNPMNAKRRRSTHWQ